MSHRLPRNTRRDRKTARKCRSGAVTLETILGLPILLITIFAIFLFGFILVVHQGVTHAAIEAAREAAKVPSTVAGSDAVEDAAIATADEVLAIYGLQASGAGPNAEIVVEDTTGSAWTGANIVASYCGGLTPPATTECLGTSVADATVVRVRLIVPFASIPIPDLLGTFGISFTGSRFDVSADAVR